MELLARKARGQSQEENNKAAAGVNGQLPHGLTNRTELISHDSHVAAAKMKEWDDDAPNVKYEPGMVIESVAPTFMRQTESLDSPLVQRLDVGSIVEVVSIGRGPAGQRIFVQCMHSRTGWVSVANSSLATLWCKPGSWAKCQIRPFVHSDRKSLSELEQKCFGPDERGLQKWLMLANSSLGRYFVDVCTIDNSAVIGYAAWACEQPYSKLKEGSWRSLLVLSLAVLPEWRGKRIGEQLLWHIEAC